MNDLNMKLLKQHVAILQTHMESVNRLADSLAKDAELLEINMDDGAPPKAQRCRRSQERPKSVPEWLRLNWPRLLRTCFL